jgi:hypothetical protein
VLEIYSFRYYTSGNIRLFLLLNNLLRSLPHILVLKLPRITPSGLSIGTTLITVNSRILTASGASEKIHLRNPYNTKLPLASPGCCLAITNTHFLDLFGIVGSVIITYGRSTPLNDSHRVLCVTMY